MPLTDNPVRSRPSRRDVIALGVGAFVVALVPLARRRPRPLVRRTLPLMGTIAEIAVVDRDARHGQAAIDAAFDELRTVERAMTRFDDASDIGRANRLAAHDGVRVGPATAAVVAEALAWAASSDGAFDPAVGRLVETWDVTHRHEPPPAEALRPLAARRLHRFVDVSTAPGREAVRFTDPAVALDLGGIAKGWGVDRAVDALRRFGIAGALVNVGGDLYALGEGAEGPWRVGIRSPFEPERLVGRLELSDAAIATSGDYFQYFTWRGRRYHHLLDPATGAPRRAAEHSITVLAATCLRADAAATAAFGMAEPAAARLLAARAPGATVVRRV